mgnify:CR=1 FL=1
MKTTILAVTLMMASRIASAGMLGLYPYFRPLDVHHLQPIAGALIDVKDIQNTEMTGLVPLLTHSPMDGCMLPSIVCEDWTPLAVGFSANAGSWTLAAGPVFNILPIMQVAALAVTPYSLPGIRKVLGSSSPNVTFSAGPNAEYKSATGKVYGKVFTGVALHF